MTNKLFTGDNEPLFKLSLAQYALHRKIGGGGKNYFIRTAKRLKYNLKERPADLFQASLDPLHFPEFARSEFDIGAVEYVSGFYKGRQNEQTYLNELKKRADGAGVEAVMIMIDGEGDLGAPDANTRAQNIENHKPWLDAAAFFGCHTVRLVAVSDINLPPEEQQKLIADGFMPLVEYAKDRNMSVCIENKGGISADADWINGILDLIDDPAAGTLPDFGNFAEFDYIEGTRKLMPKAKGVSVKTFDFNENGTEPNFDMVKLMDIIHTSGFTGYLGVEFEGTSMNEVTGIKKTIELLRNTTAQYQSTLN